MQQVSELTAQQKALLGEYKQKWQQVAYSTQPIDQEKATQAIEAVYKQLSKVEDFDIYFFRSPASVADLSFFNKVYPTENCYNPKKLSNLIRKINNRLRSKWIGSSIFHEIVLPLIGMVGKQLDVALRDYLNEELIFESYLNGLIAVNLKDKEKLSPIWKVAKANQRQRLEEMWMYIAAPGLVVPSSECSTCCVLDYCISELGCTYDEHLWQILKAFVTECGWTFFYQDFCFACDRPIKIILDDRNRPHAENEAAIEFSDGFKIFAKHGYSV
jgi:hypothetical protein